MDCCIGVCRVECVVLPWMVEYWSLAGSLGEGGTNESTSSFRKNSRMGRSGSEAGGGGPGGNGGPGGDGGGVSLSAGGYEDLKRWISYSYESKQSM